MKKFIILIILLIFCYVFYDLAYYNFGWYLFPKTGETLIISKTDQNNIFLNDEIIDIKGVNLTSSIPENYDTDYAISYDTYMRWFKQIKEMGANTIRISTIFNDQFYNAFYDYNKDNPTPLYLIQGIGLDEYTLLSHYDGYDDNYYGKLLEKGKSAIDIIHGRKKMYIGKDGQGVYKKDISNWVLSYIVGSSWYDTTIAYTNNKYNDKYEGEYLKTKENATAYETMLTKVMDKMLTYEKNKYNQIRTISFINSPETDPITEIPYIITDKENEIDYLKPDYLKYQYHKMVYLDISHIEQINGYNGLFAAYNVYSYYPDYLSYEKTEYEDTYYSYLEKLNLYHNIPVVITEFGFSTSRAISGLGNLYGTQGGLTEIEQGNSLVKAYNTIKKSGSAGAIVYNWQDSWNETTWNIIEKVDLNNIIYWSDAQSADQGLGLLTFESDIYVDGEINDWKNIDNFIEDNYKMKIQYDNKYIYFLIEGDTSLPIYIPIDITPKSGSKNGIGLTFDKEVDFIICLDDNPKILVQERYNVLKAINSYEVENKNGYINPPLKNSLQFDTINLLLEPFNMSIFSKNYNKSTIYETGKLNLGNANPNSDEYNSLADFYKKDGLIELRIPWQILNFSDPSNMYIHDDYYQNYGVENIKINQMYVGIGNAGMIELSSYNLKGWDKLEYNERLKKSYYILQKEWRQQ